MNATTATRPATTAGLVVWVERESGYVAGHARTWAEADDLAARCNLHFPSDPAQVRWCGSLGSLVA
jgi:hypothetical protein